jgi:hypothetical protein
LTLKPRVPSTRSFCRIRGPPSSAASGALPLLPHQGPFSFAASGALPLLQHQGPSPFCRIRCPPLLSHQGPSPFCRIRGPPPSSANERPGLSVWPHQGPLPHVRRNTALTLLLAFLFLAPCNCFFHSYISAHFFYWQVQIKEQKKGQNLILIMS